MVRNPAAPPLFLGSNTFGRAAFGGNHPLNFVRHSAVVDLAKIMGWLGDDDVLSMSPATVDQLAEFHDPAYITALQYADSEGRVEPEIRKRYQIGTFENPLFPGVFERAATTVGGSVLAAEQALEGHVTFHPSGGTHHGRRDRACGFCYFNDPVFAILTFLKAGLERVMYVDLDAHHGDGVEVAFADDDRVATLSIHEEKRWPFTGGASSPESGVYNLAVPAGFNDTELDYLMQNAVLPVADAFQPEALVLCCGADSLAGDPLSKMQLSNVALWQSVEQMIALGLPTVIVGGGGYNPWTVARYWAGMWATISGQQIPAALPAAARGLLAAMSCDLIDPEDVEESWLTTISDTPYPGPLSSKVVFQANSLKLPPIRRGRTYGLA